MHLSFAQILDSFNIKDNFAIAVSGGMDSMVLLNLIAESSLKGLVDKAIVLTVNHGLRVEAEQEINFVYEQSKKLGFLCYKLVWRGADITSNIQASARNIRYQLLCDWCNDNNITNLFLAHHQDDQLETILMHIERGSGIDGLVGMRKIIHFNNITIYRPLLSFTKCDLKRYATEKRIAWVNDPSNENIKYRRVLYRNIIKVNNELNILANRICLTAIHAERALSAILYYVRCSFDLCLEIHELGYLDIKLAEFYQLPQEIAMRILMYCLMVIGQKKYKPRYQQFSMLFDKIWLKKFCGVQTFYGCKIKKNNNKISLFRELYLIKDQEVSFLLEKKIIWDDRFVLKIASFEKNNIMISALGKNSHIPEHLKSYVRDVVYTLPVLKSKNKVLAYPLQIHLQQNVGGSFAMIEIIEVIIKKMLIDITYRV